MGILASYIAQSMQNDMEQQKRQQLAQQAYSYAADQFGADSKEAKFAAMFPEQAPALFAQQFNPAVQQNRKQQDYMAKLLESRMGGGATQQPLDGITWNGPRYGESQPAQGSALAQMAPRTQSRGVDDAEVAALIAGPDVYARYLADEPTRKKNQAEIKKAESELAAPQKARQDIDRLSLEAKSVLDKLLERGAISSTHGGIGQNVGSALANLPVAGSGIQSAFDPESQALRDTLTGIKSQQQTLYRAAANLPGTVGDSAKESAALGAALVDPSISYEANVERLKNFVNTYGANPADVTAKLTGQPSALQQMGQQNSLQAQADAAIKAGADPEMVRARLQQLQGGR